MYGIAKTVMFYFGSYTPTKEQLIDPFSTIIKLAILSFKPDYSKLSIHHNQIYIQEPHIYQFAVRYLYGDCKDNINVLLDPIILACEHYLNPSYELYEDVKIVFLIALKGLLKLQETYGEQTVIGNCIRYYSLIINSFLNEEDVKKNFKIDKDHTIYSDMIIDSLYENWTIENVKIIISLFDNLEKNMDVSILRVIETYMESMDSTIYHNITKTCVISGIV